MTDIADTMAALYRERAHLVAYLAAVYPSVLAVGGDPVWPDYTVVYVTSPQGQLSWHIHKSDLDLFRHVPAGPAEWDGHDTDEKYRRLDAVTRALADLRRHEDTR